MTYICPFVVVAYIACSVPSTVYETYVGCTEETSPTLSPSATEKSFKAKKLKNCLKIEVKFPFSKTTNI